MIDCFMQRQLPKDALQKSCSKKFLKIHIPARESILCKVSQEAVSWRGSVKKIFLEISQNPQENPCAKVPFSASSLQLY